MKLIKKVNRLEVKRCFVLSNRFTSKKIRKESIKKHIIKPDKETFSKNIALSKSAILKMKEFKLDHFISEEYKKRLKAYNSVNWHVGYANLNEVGLWKGAGGLPKEWTRGSLKDSAEKMSLESKRDNSKFLRIRAMKTVPEIICFKPIIKKEKYLLPIILPGGTIPNCRKGMKRMKGDIDDGCMRSLALAISGDKKIKAYIGTMTKPLWTESPEINNQKKGAN